MSDDCAIRAAHRQIGWISIKCHSTSIQIQQEKERKARIKEGEKWQNGKKTEQRRKTENEIEIDWQ
jgi:hypothetical protein